MRAGCRLVLCFFAGLHAMSWGPFFWTTIFMNTLALSETLSTLSDGCILRASAGLDVRLATHVPVAFDVHWLRSQGGFLLGTTGIRVDAAAEAAISISYSGPCLATVQRQDRAGAPWLRLSLESGPSPAAAPRVSVRAALAAADRGDPVCLALTGQHPIQRLREVFQGVGGPLFSTCAHESGVPTVQLAALAALWPTVSASTESALCKAALDPAQFAAIASTASWLATECTAAPALQQRFLAAASGAGVPAPPLLLEWLEALTGAPACRLLPDSSFVRATQAARAMAPLFHQPGLAATVRYILDTQAAEPCKDADYECEFAQRLYDATGAALAQAVRAELSPSLRGEAQRGTLLDASFRMDEPGVDLYRQALNGDLTPVFEAASPSVEVHATLLPPCQPQRRVFEVHLPSILSASLENERFSLAQMEISAQATGRLAVVRAPARDVARRTVRLPVQDVQQIRMIIAAMLASQDGAPVNDNYSLTFADVRELRPGQDQEQYRQVLSAYGAGDVHLPEGPARARLTVSLPGSAVQAWTQVPLACTETLTPVLRRVSLALQATLRRWLPVLYLEEVDGYEAPGVVLPLLAYQLSRPFARADLHQFTYDPLSGASVLSALNSAAPRLAEPLTRIHARLTAAGQHRLAACYDPETLPRILRKIAKERRYFAALLDADSFVIEQFLSLARYSRQLATMAARNPKSAARDLNALTNAFSEVFHRRLSRLFAKQDFTQLGSMLLIEATAALAGRRDSLQTSFTIEPVDGSPEPAC